MTNARIFLLEGKKLTLNELVAELHVRAVVRKAVLRREVKHER